MIVLLGASGYIGSAFSKRLALHSIESTAVSRKDVDYTQPSLLREFLRSQPVDFLINCSGYTGRPNVDGCETNQVECFKANVDFPVTIAEVCSELKLYWGHISSGCIYNGSSERPDGFIETDEPNFSFQSPPCSYYSGTKALAESRLANFENIYLWRPRMPFNQFDGPRNYLSKLLRYDCLLNATNSISHLDEFVDACIECWLKRVPPGIYNVVNTGAVTTFEIVDLIQRILKPKRDFQFFRNESHFMQVAAVAPRSNCILDNQKLKSAGIAMRDAREAIEQSLIHWTTARIDC